MELSLAYRFDADPLDASMHCDSRCDRDVCWRPDATCHPACLVHDANGLSSDDGLSFWARSSRHDAFDVPDDCTNGKCLEHRCLAGEASRKI